MAQSWWPCIDPVHLFNQKKNWDMKQCYDSMIKVNEQKSICSQQVRKLIQKKNDLYQIY